MPILGRDEILAANDLVKELVDVPEWGEGAQVYVRALTGAERDRYVGSSMEQRGKNQTVNYQNISARLCAMAMCDESGARLFKDSEVATLAAKNAMALQRVFAAASRLAGLTENDVEELTKGLEDDPFGGSPTA